MKLKTIFVREEQRYSVDKIRTALGLDGVQDKAKKEFKSFIKDLLTRKVINVVPKDDKDRDIFVDNDYNDNKLVESDKYYKFRFVGIVIYHNLIIYSYPKYLLDYETISQKQIYRDELKEVIKVIQKYSTKLKRKTVESTINFFADIGDSADNVLPIMFFLIDDYLQHGEYEKTEKNYVINGEGEIDWQKSIDETYPILSQGKPYYVELYTRQNIDDESDYIRRLHKCVITQCSKELSQASLVDFFDFPYIEISEDEIESFGSNTYIVERLERELTETFDDRKIFVLKALIAYFKCSTVSLLNDRSIQLVGTRNFNLVWEDVCGTVFDSQKDLSVDKVFADIETKKEQLKEYNIEKKPLLTKLIKAPVWQKENKKEVVATKSEIKPDALKFEPKDDTYIFYILDAKYYCPKWTDDEISNEPGAEDIIKQYMYCVAYIEFLKAYKIRETKNYFLMPRATNTDCYKGDAWIEFIKNLNLYETLNLGKIKIRFLDPHTMYENYLNNREPMSLEYLDTLGE